jgi:hypothetical protein
MELWQVLLIAVGIPAWVMAVVWGMYELVRFGRILLERTGEDVRWGGTGSTKGGYSGGRRSASTRGGP